MAEREGRAEVARDPFFRDSPEGSPRLPRVYSRDFLDAFWGAGGGARESLPIDVSECDDCYVVTAELPGATREDLQVELVDDALTIRGEKRHAHEERSERLRSGERWFGAFSRTFTLPADAGSERARAVLENGVLTVTIAKRARREPCGVAITVP